MTEQFTYKITKEGEKEHIFLSCPDCHTPLGRDVLKGTKSGKDSCALCGCEFEWERK